MMNKLDHNDFLVGLIHSRFKKDKQFNPKKKKKRASSLNSNMQRSRSLDFRFIHSQKGTQKTRQFRKIRRKEAFKM